MSSEPKSSDNLQLLKELMLGDEQREIASLRQQFEGLEAESIERLSRDLAAAIELRNRLGDDSFDELVAAIQSGTESAIERSVSQDKSRMAKALFPIMGPAIRSYVVELFRSMAEDLNETIRNTTSIERWKWRLQARSAGIPFSEYVLIKTANYQVEEAYLIQRETGILLQHVDADSDDQNDDADLVSGMFTAIRTFVRDSFSDADEEQPEELKRFTFGERQVVIEDSPSMVLAAVVRGSPPPAVRNELKAILEELHRKFQKRLEDFSGDMAEMAETRPHLEGALMANEPEAKKKGGFSPVWLIVLLLIGGIGWWIYAGIQERRRWDGFQAALEAEPGIEVLGVEEAGGVRAVSGLRDPLVTKDLNALAADHEIDAEEVRFTFTAFHSLEPEFVSRRKADDEAAWKQRRTELIDAVAAGDEKARELAETTARNLEATRKQVEASAAQLQAALEDLSGTTGASRKQLLRELLQSRYGHLDGVEFVFGDGGVTITGSVPEPEYSQLVAQIGKIESLGEIDTSGLENATAVRVTELEGEMGANRVTYENGTLNETAQRSILTLAWLAYHLRIEGAKLGREYRFEVVAHPLIGELREANRVIEQNRADLVRRQLIEAGLQAANLTATIDEDVTRAGQGVSLVPKTEAPTTPP